MKKCMKCGGAMKPKMAKGGQANLTKTMPGYNATTNPITMKKGGATKNAKLAAMASPKDKITRADIITAAKKKARAKKK
jgi:hypothetical protein